MQNYNWLYFLKVLLEFAIVILPSAGYIAQYQLISKNKSIGTFSTQICGLLIFANILLINFYFIHQYEQALLIKSILLLVVQLFLLKLCNSLTPHSSWRWPLFSQNLLVIVGIVFGFGLVTFLMKSNTILVGLYGSILGFIGLGLQAFSIAPQIIRNIMEKRMIGFSRILMTINVISNALKLLYFILLSAPWPFMAATLVQLVIDLILITQSLYYAKYQQPKNPQPPITGFIINQPQKINDTHNNTVNKSISQML